MANNGSHLDEFWKKRGMPHLLQSDTVLVDWLFTQLDASHPQVPLPKKIRREINEFRQNMLRNGYFEFPMSTSREIFWSIYPTHQSDDAEHCGLRLLQFAGRFSDAITLVDANPKVPVVHVARMMISTGEREFKGLRVTADRKRIRSTSEFEHKFGVSVDVRIPKQHRYEFVWDLTDMLDRQQE